MLIRETIKYSLFFWENIVLIRTIVVCTLLFAGIPHARAFPRDFSGTWEDKRSKDSGPIAITISEVGGEEIRGVISIEGSAYCTSPVSFRGVLNGSTATISSDALKVCGYHGKLTGEVRREHDALYVGSFQYVYWGITWAKGTFRLTPMESPGYK